MMKPTLKRLGSNIYLVFPYADNAEKWEFFFCTLLRRKRVHFLNYRNAFKLI